MFILFTTFGIIALIAIIFLVGLLILGDIRQKKFNMKTLANDAKEELYTSAALLDFDKFQIDIAREAALKMFGCPIPPIYEKENEHDPNLKKCPVGTTFTEEEDCCQVEDVSKLTAFEQALQIGEVLMYAFIVDYIFAKLLIHLHNGMRTLTGVKLATYKKALAKLRSSPAKLGKCLGSFATRVSTKFTTTSAIRAGVPATRVSIRGIAGATYRGIKTAAAATRAGVVTMKTGAKAGAKAGVAGAKAVLFPKLASSGPLIVAMLVFEVISLTLDMTDVHGYDTYTANSEIMKMRNALEVSLQNKLIEGNEEEDVAGERSYPMTFPVFHAYPDVADEYTKELLGSSKIFQGALSRMETKYMIEFLVNALAGLSEDGAEDGGDELKMSEEAEDSFAMALEAELSYQHFERDKIMMRAFKKFENGKFREYVKMHRIMSSPSRPGISLSVKGADEYNKRQEENHLIYSNPTIEIDADDIPDDYKPFVASYSNKYRVLDKTNPGPKHNPNVIEKRLMTSVVLAQPWAPIISSCSQTKFSKDSKIGKLKIVKHNYFGINPAEFGTTFDYSKGKCNYTKEYCDRMGLKHVNRGDCELNKGQETAEMIFGTTITRSTIRSWEGRIDDWKSGDANRIALATARLTADIFTFGLYGVFGEMLERDLTNFIRNCRGRGIGLIPRKCSKSKEKKGLLCYNKCRDGYESKGLMCKKRCPAGSKSIGLFCHSTFHNYIPSNKSSNPFSKGFYERKPCRDGYKYCKSGWTCQKRQMTPLSHSLGLSWEEANALRNKDKDNNAKAFRDAFIKYNRNLSESEKRDTSEAERFLAFIKTVELSGDTKWLRNSPCPEGLKLMSCAAGTGYCSKEQNLYTRWKGTAPTECKGKCVFNGDDDPKCSEKGLQPECEGQTGCRWEPEGTHNMLGTCIDKCSDHNNYKSECQSQDGNACKWDGRTNQNGLCYKRCPDDRPRGRGPMCCSATEKGGN